MNVIDITSRLFTEKDREELSSLLRQIAQNESLEKKELDKLHQRAETLMRKAGGAEKFFKNHAKINKDILS